jgi:hypothetical protein
VCTVNQGERENENEIAVQQMQQQLQRNSLCADAVDRQQQQPTTDSTCCYSSCWLTACLLLACCFLDTNIPSDRKWPLRARMTIELPIE